MVITKSQGVTRTERLLAELSENTFLKLWSYPNPFKDDTKELCDLLVVFENNVVLFFDRESRKFDGAGKDIFVSWKRWKKEAIEKQISTANGAAKYLKNGRSVFVDKKSEIPFPIPINKDAKIHKIIVAHGAKEACIAFSEQNISGSLGVCYGDDHDNSDTPFLINLDKTEPVHVLDSQNLETLFGSLDTAYDFTSYLEEKERAILKYDNLMYCGEEDLLAHYYMNFNTTHNRYQIGTDDNDVNGFMVGEGEWDDFIKSDAFKRRELANENSYLWDQLVQRTCDNALKGVLGGNADVFRGKSAIYEMAKEPRFSRRALSQFMSKGIQNFPISDKPIVRNMSFMPSFFKNVAYVFLQLKMNDKGDYEEEYRPKRQAMLEIACGAARNKFPHLKKIIGIAIDAPAYHKTNSEDFILLECDEWPEEQAEEYRERNKDFHFFETKQLVQTEMRVKDFPEVSKVKKHKLGRNEKCYCGSGKKYKKCCLGI